MDRRDFLRNVALFGTGVAVGGLGILTLRSATPPDAPPAPLTHPGTDRRVRPEDLAGAAPMLLQAEFADGPVVVLKLPVALLRAAAEARGYDTAQYAVRHPDDPDAALVAYDARCTHMGCVVAWNGELGGSLDVPDYDEDGFPDGRIMCPCHQAQFDAYDLATNVAGPAPRPLDAVLLALMRDGEGAFLVGVRRIHQQNARDADQRGAGADFSL